MKSIVVCGTINHDLLLVPGGVVHDQLGGLVYTITALSTLFGSELKIRPVCWVGRDLEKRVREFLEKLPGVSRSGIRVHDGPNNLVELDCRNPEKKRENQRHRVPPITRKVLEPHLDAEGLLLNFTSGWDLEPATQRFLLETFPGWKYLDLHSLTLGPPRRGRRYLRRLPNRDSWIAGADMLQLTRSETFSLTGIADPGDHEVESFLGEVTERLVIQAVVTDGARGAWWRRRGGRTVFLPAAAGAANPETTGCGDVFGAAFLGTVILGGTPEKALKTALRAAAWKTHFTGVEELRRLGDYIEEIR